MKNIAIKTKIICVSLVLCLSILFLSGFFTIGIAKADVVIEINFVTAQNMSAYDSISQNQNLLNLTDEHIQQNMDEGLIIGNVKNLIDFNDGKYTLFELNPIGYIIYHNESGKFIEYSSSAPSPYSDKDGILYYGGPMQYFKQQEDILVGTVDTESTILASEIDTLQESSEIMSTKLIMTQAEENVNYINGTIEEIPSQAAQRQIAPRSSPSLSMASFFTNIRTSTEIGYRNGGVCGYVAAGMQLAYNRFAYDSGLVSSSYLNMTTQKLNGAGLTNRLLEINGQDTSATTFPGTTAAGMQDCVAAYLNTVPNQKSWEIAWSDLAVSANSNIDNNHPVVLFGNFEDVQSGGRINHAIVAYGYQKYGLFWAFTRYRCHYGWSGYYDVSVESVLIGTSLYLKMI